MIRYLIALEKELELFKKHSGELPEGRIDLIGIRAADIPTDITDDDVVVNVGFAGGYKIPIGTVVAPRYVFDAETMRLKRMDSAFPIEGRICLTANRFVSKPYSDSASVYDMELYKIAEAPHKKLYALKIVSEILNEYTSVDYDDPKPWEKVGELIRNHVKG